MGASISNEKRRAGPLPGYVSVFLAREAPAAGHKPGAGMAGVPPLPAEQPAEPPPKDHVTGVQMNRSTTAMYATTPEAPPDLEQLSRLHEESTEEQRSRKAQYEATQKVQAVVRGKAARAEVDAKRSEMVMSGATEPAAAPDGTEVDEGAAVTQAASRDALLSDESNTG